MYMGTTNSSNETRQRACNLAEEVLKLPRINLFMALFFLGFKRPYPNKNLNFVLPTLAATQYVMFTTIILFNRILNVL